MDYLFIFHANLHYSGLPQDKMEFVIRKGYDALLDLFIQKYPDCHFCFEASGFTIQKMAELAPDVLDRYKQAFADGTCEFMGSPFAHSMLANFPFEDGLKSLLFSMETYQKHLGFTPVSAWNPECSWTSRIPEMFSKAGFKNLITDWESFLISTRPEVRAVEYDPDRTRKDGHHMPFYPVDPDDPTLHFPLKVSSKITGLMRSGRVCNDVLWYLMGQDQEARNVNSAFSMDKALRAIEHWTGKKKDGCLLLYADDAEYVGTTGYFFLKYYNQWRLFEHSPESVERLDNLLNTVGNLGKIITVTEAINKYPALDNIEVRYEDGMAWHRTFSDAWKATPWAKELDPHCMEIHRKLISLEKTVNSPTERELLKTAWFHLICAENSDGRWPPPPHKPGQWNIDYCWDNVHKAEDIVKKLTK
ncbi:MAG: hypothetical protein A2Y12_17935 [Planctomycetes bacterium GWF2_42_9]|nr:MAG: hypothetical protein A2Y12_17935 [Planctomycetes bacterium GWF2_42_9]